MDTNVAHKQTNKTLTTTTTTPHTHTPEYRIGEQKKEKYVLLYGIKLITDI
jgi:hypothetical protein